MDLKICDCIYLMTTTVQEGFMAVLSPVLLRNSDIVKRFIDNLCDVDDLVEGLMLLPTSINLLYCQW